MVAVGSAGASSFAPSMSTALAPGLARKLKKVGGKKSWHKIFPLELQLLVQQYWIM